MNSYSLFSLPKHFVKVVHDADIERNIVYGIHHTQKLIRCICFKHFPVAELSSNFIVALDNHNLDDPEQVLQISACNAKIFTAW